MKDIIYWVWLAEKNGAGHADAINLLKYFPGGAREIFEASREELAQVKECNSRFISSLSNHDLSRAERILDFCFMNGIRIIPCVSESYPQRLNDLYNKPIVLYTRGFIEDLDERFCVSIIGSRSMSSYGKHMAFNLARQLIAYGAIVISGAAYGIDSVANNTAIYLEEPTVAVLGSGVNVPYPAPNKEMLDQIGSNGMVISEFPPNTPPYGKNFPIRNRIISGLADAVVVVEAGQRSGAQITARLAADQGRMVYAVPGNVGAPNSIGTNRMIRDGAKLVTSAEDIIEDFADKFNLSKIQRIVSSDKYLRYEYNYNIRLQRENLPLSSKDQDNLDVMRMTKENSKYIRREIPDIHDPGEYRRAVAGNTSSSRIQPPEQSDGLRVRTNSSADKNDTRKLNVEMLDGMQRRVFDAIPDGTAVTADKIIRDSGLSTEDVLSTLTMLELLAAVEALPGGLYVKTI